MQLHFSKELRIVARCDPFSCASGKTFKNFIGELKHPLQPINTNPIDRAFPLAILHAANLRKRGHPQSPKIKISISLALYKRLCCSAILVLQNIVDS